MRKNRILTDAGKKLYTKRKAEYKNTTRKIGAK